MSFKQKISELIPAYFADKRAYYFKIKQLKINYDEGSTIFNAFDRRQSIFIHIPKCAGISVGQSLYGKDITWGHYTWSEVRDVLGKKKFNNYYKYAFVRNPWDRVYSAYNFLINGGINSQDKLWAKKYLAEYADFEDFVLRGLLKPEVQSWIHFIPQSNFIYDNKGRLMVDFIGRFENIEADYERLRERIGGDGLLFLNQNKSQNAYLNYYSDKTISIISEVYSRDVEHFKYSFS